MQSHEIDDLVEAKLAMIISQRVAEIVRFTPSSGNSDPSSAVALVIGNDYHNADHGNCSRDAEMVARAFQCFGFKTVVSINETGQVFRQTARAFERVADGSSLAVIFYSGGGSVHRGITLFDSCEPGQIPEDGSNIIALAELMAYSRGVRGPKIFVANACRNYMDKTDDRIYASRDEELSGGLDDYLVVTSCGDRELTPGYFIDARGKPSLLSPFAVEFLNAIYAADVDVRTQLSNACTSVQRGTGGVLNPIIRDCLTSELVVLSRREHRPFFREAC